MDGVAVHGIAGNRSQYQPIGELSDNECSLLHWYRSIGIRRFYVADLNGLMGSGRQRIALLTLAREVRRDEILWIDCGWAGSVSQVDQDWLKQMNRSIANGASLRWVIATETADSIDVMNQMLEFIDASNLTLSLDFRAGAVCRVPKLPPIGPWPLEKEIFGKEFCWMSPRLAANPAQEMATCFLTSFRGLAT